MYPLTTHFNKLRQNTLPPENRRKAAQELPAKVQAFLKDHGDYETVYPHTCLVGSYAQKLCVGDVKDVDFLVRIRGAFEGDDMILPRDAISTLAKALEGLAAHLDYESDGIEIKTARRSVHVYFKNEDFHLDLVICIAPDGMDKPLYVPCKMEKKWVKSDPLGYIRKLNEINSENGYNVKRLARVFKHFIQKQMIYMRPKSYWLGALLLQEIEEHGFDKSKSQAELFNWLVTKIYNRYLVTLNTSETATPNVKDPMLGHNISWNWGRNDFETFMTRLKEARDWSEKALADETTREKAIEYWQKIFGADYFPTSVEEETNQLAESSAPGKSWIDTAGRVAAAAVSVPAILTSPTRFHGGKKPKHGA
jgi:hypothetical protein